MTKVSISTLHQFQLNGKTTLSENIADNGGMKVAFQAYKSWIKKARKDSFVLPGLDFTPDQLFFIGMSQVRQTDNLENFHYRL